MSDRRLPWAYLAIIALANALIHSSMNICFALVPVFQSEFNVTIEVVGLIVTTPLIVKILASLPTGILTDRYDPRKLITLSLLFIASGGLFVSQSHSTLTLVAGFSAISLGQAVFHPAAYMIIVRLFSAKRRNLALGLNGTGATLGTAIGPISVGLIMYLLGQDSWRLGYLIWVVPAFACSTLILFLRMGQKTLIDHTGAAITERKEGGLPLKSVFTRTYVAFLIFIGIRSFGVQSITTYLTTYLKEARGMSVDFASILFGAMSLTGTLAAPIGGYIADRRGEKYALSLAYLGETAMLLGLVLSPSFLFLVPLTILYGFMDNASLAPSSALVAKLSLPSRRGTAYAVYSLFSNIAGSLAPFVCAYIVYQWSVWFVFPVAISTYLTAFVILYLKLGKERQPAVSSAFSVQ